MKIRDRTIFLAWGCLFALAGLVVFAVSLWGIWAPDLRTWPKTWVHAEYWDGKQWVRRPSAEASGPIQRVFVYIVDGRRYEKSRFEEFTPPGGEDWGEVLASWAARVEAGGRCDIRYNPSDPADAHFAHPLNPQWNRWIGLPFAVVPLLMGLTAIWKALRARS